MLEEGGGHLGGGGQGEDGGRGGKLKNERMSSRGWEQELLLAYFPSF